MIEIFAILEKIEFLEFSRWLEMTEFEIYGTVENLYNACRLLKF
jgi:hypothetical protein